MWPPFCLTTSCKRTLAFVTTFRHKSSESAPHNFTMCALSCATFSGLLCVKTEITHLTDKYPGWLCGLPNFLVGGYQYSLWGNPGERLILTYSSKCFALGMRVDIFSTVLRYLTPCNKQIGKRKHTVCSGVTWVAIIKPKIVVSRRAVTFFPSLNVG